MEIEWSGGATPQSFTDARGRASNTMVCVDCPLPARVWVHFNNATVGDKAAPNMLKVIDGKRCVGIAPAQVRRVSVRVHGVWCTRVVFLHDRACVPDTHSLTHSAAESVFVCVPRSGLLIYLT